MKKRTILFAMIAMLFAFTGCDKKDDNNTTEPDEPTVVKNKFAGVYELLVDYDIYFDGELSIDDSGSMSGLLTITATSDTTVSVQGVMQFGRGDAMLYETTGTIENDIILHLNPSTYVNPNASGEDAAPISIYYYDIEYASPLEFRTSMLTYVNGHQLEYEMVNTATKYY